MKRSAIAAGVAAAVLAVPAVAAAHITVNPREAAPGGFSVMTVRVPNERDHKGTVKVDLRLPHGFIFLSYKKVPGWKAKITKKKLSTPVTLEGLKIDREVTRVVWDLGNPKKDGIIRPDEFEEFPLSVRVPDGQPGQAARLLVPSRPIAAASASPWTGGPDADTPAPRVTLTAPAEEH